MKIAVYSTKSYDRRFLTAAAAPAGHALTFFEARLRPETVRLAEPHDAVCIFVNDVCDATVIDALRQAGVRLILLRCAGFNNVDIAAAAAARIEVARVPAYSPHAVAEHTLALILGLNRRIYRAYNRVREANFALDGLLGFDIYGKTVGVIGTGAIGRVVCQILRGFGCTVLASDPFPDKAVAGSGVAYVPLGTLFADSDIITLQCPLTPDTHHLIDERAVGEMRDGVMLINTSRGALVDTRAVIAALKTGKIGALGLDVYEEEGDLFFENLSEHVIADDVFSRLLTFPNVLITGHQAFFTNEALSAIASTTMENATRFEREKAAQHRVLPEFIR